MPLDAPNPLFTGDRLRDLILCYAGPWAFLPYMRNREDSELLWHARQGAILAFAECTVALAALRAAGWGMVEGSYVKREHITLGRLGLRILI